MQVAIVTINESGLVMLHNQRDEATDFDSDFSISFILASMVKGWNLGAETLVFVIA